MSDNPTDNDQPETPSAQPGTTVSAPRPEGIKQYTIEQLMAELAEVAKREAQESGDRIRDNLVERLQRLSKEIRGDGPGRSR
jgi:hypothetical protein